MRRDSLLQALLLSFGSADAYRGAARRRHGRALVYLLVLAAVTTALVVVRLHEAVGRIATREAPPLIAQLPEIAIRRGEASVAAPTPHVIRAPETGRALAIIDTSGAVTSLEGSEARVLLTRTQVMFRRNDTEIRVFDLAGVDRFDVGPERAGRWARAAAAWLAPLAAPLVLAGLYALRLLQALFGAGLVLAIAPLRRVRLDVAAAMRLAALAITPPTLLLDLAGFLGAQVPYAGLAWAALATAWTVFAVRACERPEAPHEAGGAGGPH
jgi:hypothetical protein